MLGAAGRPAEAMAQYELTAAITDLYRSNGVNVDLEQSLFDAEHGRPKQALRVARAEYQRRRSIHVADALAWALYANGDYETAKQILDGGPSSGDEERTVSMARGDDRGPARATS